MHGVKALAQLFWIASVCGAAFGSCECNFSLIHALYSVETAGCLGFTVLFLYVVSIYIAHIFTGIYIYIPIQTF